jgi:hypothetical protein
MISRLKGSMMSIRALTSISCWVWRRLAPRRRSGRRTGKLLLFIILTDIPANMRKLNVIMSVGLR